MLTHNGPTIGVDSIGRETLIELSAAISIATILQTLAAVQVIRFVMDGVDANTLGGEVTRRFGQPPFVRSER